MGIKIPLIKYIPLLFIVFLTIVSLWKGYINIKDFRRERLNIYILFYFCLTLLSGIGTAYFPISMLKAVYYGLTGISIYFIIHSWQLNQTDKMQFLKGIAIFGFVVSLYGISAFIIKKDILFGSLEYSKSNLMNPKFFLEIGRISSSFGNPLFLGGFLSSIFPISLYLHLVDKEQEILPYYLTAIIPIVIFMAIILTFSVGAFFGIILFYIFYHLKIKELYRESHTYKIIRSFLFLGIILLCIVLFMLTANVLLQLYNKDYIFGKYFNRIDFHKLANIDAISLRFDSLRHAINFLKTPSLLFGIGIGKIGTGVNPFSRVSMDNYYCLSLIESGILVTIFMLIIFYLIIKKANNNFKTLVSQGEKGLDVFLLASLMIFFINMLFWDVFNHPTMRILFWSFVGFLI